MFYPRFFSFGCSFTKYAWPTWADIIGTNYKIHHNFGNRGAGNYYIASKLYETHLTYKIKKEDVVIVMLSSANRLDIYDENLGRFNLNGNIYNSENIFGKKFVNEVWNDTHSIWNTWFSVQTIKTLLESIGCRYKIIEAFGLLNTDFGVKLKITNSIENLIKDYTNCVYTTQNLYNFSKNYNPPSYKGLDGNWDGHPTIMCNHDFVKMHISEFYDNQMYEIAKKWESEIQLDVHNSNFSKQKIRLNIL